ncbi:MAG: hypothetical protein AAGC46_14410, partial [Solirubrobacteraceae bacterium]
AYALGEHSSAETLWDRAAKLSDTAPVTDVESAFLFDHREGKALTREEIDGDKDLVIAQLRAAYGDAEWMVTDRVINRMREESTARANRYFLNAVVPGDESYISLRHVDKAIEAAGADRIEPGDDVCVGFDGSRADDGTALYAVRMADGLVQRLGYWQRPVSAPPDWKVPGLAVEEAMREAFSTYKVIKFYGDPPYWPNEIDRLGRDFPEQVFEWFTSRRMPMWQALERFRIAIEEGDAKIAYDHDPQFGDVLRTHLGNAVRTPVPAGYGIAKPKQKSKIDAAIAATLAWEARADALVDGWGMHSVSRMIL